MMKAAKDFEYPGVVVKAGDEIKPGMLADDLVKILVINGIIVDDKPAPKEHAKKADHKTK